MAAALQHGPSPQYGPLLVCIILAASVSAQTAPSGSGSTSPMQGPLPADISSMGSFTANSQDSSPSSTPRSTSPTDPDELVQSSSMNEQSVLRSLVAGGFMMSQAMEVQRNGVRNAAWRVDEQSRDDTLFSVIGSDASVLVPNSATTDMESNTACAVTLFDPPTVAQLEGTDAEAKPVTVAAAINVQFWQLDNFTKVEVSGLQDPIVIGIPVEDNAKTDCAFWDVDSQQWVSQGLGSIRTTSNGNVLMCSTTHLTLFAAIVRGIEEALTCSQLTLLSVEGIQELWRGDWYRAPVTIFYWATLLVLLVMMVAACVQDHLRASRDVWNDEFFLIPLSWSLTAGGREEASTFTSTPTTTSTSKSESMFEEGQGQGKGQGDSARANELTTMSTRSLPGSRLSRVTGCLLVPLLWCRQSSALRDAFDDVASRWFEHFSEVRDFLEGIWEGLSDEAHRVEVGGGRATRLAHVAMGAFVARSARRQAGASLGLSDEVVKFITDDKDLRELLVLAAVKSAESGGEKPVTQEEQRLRAWRDLHNSVVSYIDSHWHEVAYWRLLPPAVARLFMVVNPFVSVFLNNHFWTSSMRVLFFMCELLGALMVAAAFFQASGEAKGKRSRGCNDAGSGEGGMVEEVGGQIGRLLVIGAGSLVLAGIPVTLLASLHSRRFKKFTDENAAGWKHQLLVWRIQDFVLWLLGVLYASFCGFFVALFLANVDPGGDHQTWGLSALISLLEDTLAIPLMVALLVPFFATTFLKLVCWMKGHDRKELLQRQREEIKLRGNWGSTEVSI